jgi:hypothetical protein
MSGILLDDFEPFEDTIFHAARPPYVLTAASGNEPPFMKRALPHWVTAGESWTNATGVLFAGQDSVDLTIGDEPIDEQQFERFEADTAHPRTAGMLAQALDKVSTPTKRENISLPFDPDDHPLF